MRILAICPAIPAKDAKGYQVQAYHRLRRLSTNHSITVVCFRHGGSDEKHKTALTDIGIRVRMVPWNRTTALFEVLKAFFDIRMPLQCALFSSAAFKAEINVLMREFDPEFVHATTIRILPNLNGQFKPLILDLVDSMGLNFRRRVERAPWYSRLLWKFEQRRVAGFERVAAENSLTSFVVSSVDKEEIGCAKVNVLPLGVGEDYYSRGKLSTEPIIAFTGNMSYRPNIEAALWFATKCWPSISTAIPEAVFLIAGNRPNFAVRNLRNNPTIRVTGHVLNMTDVLRSAQVAIAPMQSGSGMQFKVLEAMACGIPVITSTLGLGDIKAKPNTDLIVANSPAEFIKSSLELLGSSDLRRAIGSAGHNFAAKHHTWNAINNDFESTVFSKLTEIGLLSTQNVKDE